MSQSVIDTLPGEVMASSDLHIHRRSQNKMAKATFSTEVNLNNCKKHRNAPTELVSVVEEARTTVAVGESEGVPLFDRVSTCKQ